MHSFESGGSAVVVGASGGIGSALVSALVQERCFKTVFALARTFEISTHDCGRIRRSRIDVTDEGSIEEAARTLARPLRLVIVATGVLHTPNVLAPEKTYRALDSAALLESYRINAVGPALVAKHTLPLMAPHGRSVFAALSARVGSISDNRTGGWHAYRASKAALNMIVRNLAIETSRRNPEQLCVGLHPGTVDTALSRPFQRSVPAQKLLTPAIAATRLLAVIDGLSAAHNGTTLAWDGSSIPP